MNAPRRPEPALPELKRRIPTLDEWEGFLVGLTESEQRTFIFEDLRDKAMLPIFGLFFFPHILSDARDVPDCHIDLLDEISADKDSGIVFPRGFAKSTWEKIDTLHDIVYGLEDLIVYVGNTVTDAGYHLESIKSELESNVLLRDIYGSLAPAESGDDRRDRARKKKWTNKHIEAENGVMLVARGRNKGRGVNIKNKRPTKIVVDDGEDDQSVNNAEQREKYHRWLYDVIFPSLNPKRGKIKVIGTAIHELSEVVQFYRKHGGIFRRAIEDGRSIWEAMWPIEKLNAIREKVGTRAFNREYMNNPSSDDEAMIKPEWMARDEYVVLPEGAEWRAVLSLDPQSGESAQSDEYALTALYARRGTVQRYVVEQKAGRASQTEQAREVVRMWLRHKKLVQAVGIEKVMTQVAVWQILQEWRAGSRSLNEPHWTREKNPTEWIDETDRAIPLIETSPEGKDKVARLQMFEADFERGEIHIRPEMTELKHQLAFTMGKSGEHDDRADGLVIALEVALKYGLTSKLEPPKTDESKAKTITGGLRGEVF